MNDVEREAQDQGYIDGERGVIACPQTYGFDKYSNLRAAYDRGWRLGNSDYDKRMKQVAKGDYEREN